MTHLGALGQLYTLGAPGQQSVPLTLDLGAPLVVGPQLASGANIVTKLSR